MSGVRGEEGSVLLIALVVMILAMTVVAGLMVHAQTSLRAERNYKVRTEQTERAENAMAFTIAALRRPAGLSATPSGAVESRTGVLGTAGTTSTHTFEGLTVTCTGDAGSGVVVPDQGFADRSVTCSVGSASTPRFRFRLRFVDKAGTNLGQAVQVLDSDFDGG